MLSGKRAFRETHTPETLTAILNEDPPDSSGRLNISLPHYSGLSYDTWRRIPRSAFQSASDLAFALEELSGSRQFYRRLPAGGAPRGHAPAFSHWLLPWFSLEWGAILFSPDTPPRHLSCKCKLRFCPQPAMDSGRILRSPPPSLPMVNSSRSLPCTMVNASCG